MAKLDRNNIRISTESRIQGGSDFFLKSVDIVADKFGGGVNDVVVKRLYDINDTLIDTRISTDIPAYSQGKIQVDPETDITEFGFSSGQFKIVYSFWRILVGEQDSPGVYVSEISPSRTEIRLVGNPTYKDQFNRFASTYLSDDEINRMLDYIFNPPNDALPYIGFSAESIVTNLPDDFKEELFNYDRSSSSALELDSYLSNILTQKIETIISNTRQSSFEYIRSNGISNQSEFKELIRREFKENIRQAFE